MENPVSLPMIKLPLTLLPQETKRVNFTGSFVMILSNTITLDPVVSADSGASCSLPAGIGLPSVRLSPDKSTTIPAVFTYVEFKNPSLHEEMTIEFMITLGVPQNARSVISGYIQMDLSAPALSSPAALQVKAPVDPENILAEELSILPANQLIKERLVQNTGDNPIWYGDASVSAFLKRGLCIYPDGNAVINCWGAVYFTAENGDSVLSSVNVLKVV